MKDDLIEKFINDNFKKGIFQKKEYLTDYLVHLEDGKSSMDIMRMFDDIIVKIGSDYSCIYFFDLITNSWLVRPNGYICY